MRFSTSLLYSLDVAIILATHGMQKDGFKPLPLLMGDDGKGMRYYVAVTPQSTIGQTRYGGEYYSDNNYKCGPLSFFDKVVVSKRDPTATTIATASAYVTDARKGTQFFTGRVDISLDTCFGGFKHHDTTVKAPYNGMPMLLDTLSLDDPIVKTLNEMCKDGELLHNKVTGDELPATNALYYGFIEDELEVEVATNAMGRIESVNAKDSTGAQYNSLRFLMRGKAMQVRLRNADQMRVLVLEPVDKSRFSGKATFAEARLDTLDGTPFTKDLLPVLSNLKEPKKKPSGLTRIRKSLKGPLSRRRSEPLEHDEGVTGLDGTADKVSRKQTDKTLSRIRNLRRLIGQRRLSSKSRKDGPEGKQSEMDDE